jgi:tRNA U34 5-carboxymethylaminomethyl modifying GTPase MnmE/TrmE
MDLIQAEPNVRPGCRAQLDGALSDRIRAILHRLLAVSADLEMILEFPEHETARTNCLICLNVCVLCIVKSLSWRPAIVRGVFCGRAFCGDRRPPNAGKSHCLTR